MKTHFLDLLGKHVIATLRVCAFCIQGICILLYILYGHTEIWANLWRHTFCSDFLTTVSLAKHAKRGQIIIERPTWQCDVVVVVIVVSVTAAADVVVVVTVIVVYLVLAFSVNAK